MGKIEKKETTGLKTEQARNRGVQTKRSRFCLLIVVFALWLLTGPVGAATGSNASAQPSAQIAYIGVYAVDFKQFSVADGTYQTNFYLNIRSDTNISMNDLEFMNGHVTSIDTITDIPEEKNYRIFAVMTANPDLVRYPFDSHTLPIVIEPKVLTEKDLVLAIDPNTPALMGKQTFRDGL